MKTISKTERVLKLFEEATRAEIMARHGICAGLSFGEYFNVKLEKTDEIRKLLYGTSDLVVLGTKWGMLKDLRTKKIAVKKKVKIKKKKVKRKIKI